ncbi:MAG: hypothetical protein Q9163_000025 [Psora crenata]
MARQRAGSRLSFRKGSSSSIPKVEASESPQEKARFHLNTKADPSRAINEAQPVDVANAQPTTGTSIRDIEHRDQDGNRIVDPDLSNPTRPRLERPLETIRSFEAAIDGSYNRRQSFRAEAPIPVHQQTRRSSYINGTNASQGYQPQRRNIQATNDGGGSYNGAINSSRPDTYYDNGTTPGTPHYGGGNRRFAPRNNPDPTLYGNNVQQGVYPSHGHQQSYDTVGTVSNGSHATDQWGNSTDPSSENSSIERAQPAPKPDLGEAYGFNGFGGAPQLHGPILEEHAQDAPSYDQPGHNQSQTMNGNGYPYQNNGSPPSVPPHGGSLATETESAPPRTPIKLGINHSIPVGSRTPPAKAEKRKSWLGKKLSRS